MEESPDCHFFLAGSCKYGDKCQFRHSEASLNINIVCRYWKENACTRSDCKYRHPKKPFIYCHFESLKSGCRNTNCAFMHMKNQNRSTTFTNTEMSTHQTSSPISSIDENQTQNVLVEMDQVHSPVEKVSTVPCIQPVVFSLNEFEAESDNEGESSKSIVCHTHEQDHLGIKSLEQLKMEKIHRESEHFYNASSHEEIGDPLDLRYLLMRKRKSNVEAESPAVKIPKANHTTGKKIITSHKRKNSSTGKLDFKIKTLDEIKQDKDKRKNVQTHGTFEETEDISCERVPENGHSNHVPKETIDPNHIPKEGIDPKLGDTTIKPDVCEYVQAPAPYSSLQILKNHLETGKADFLVPIPTGKFQTIFSRETKSESKEESLKEPSAKQNDDNMEEPEEDIFLSLEKLLEEELKEG